MQCRVDRLVEEGLQFGEVTDDDKAVIDGLSDIEFEAFRLILTKVKDTYPDISVLRPAWI